MNALELKVPPPIVALLLSLLMWGVSRITMTLDVDGAVRVMVAMAIALIGGAFSFAGITELRRAQTTLNPLKPETASSPVTGGIYRVTRNPMYVGLLLVLVAWAAFLCAPWAAAGPLTFVAYMTRFQIVPEERALLSAFGATYGSYQTRVRRWL